MAALFQPLTLRDVTLSNRIVVAPMCQYSAIDGVVQDWHLQHGGSLAASGPGLIIIEATGVVPEGRITPGCTGMYSDACEAGFTRLVRLMKAVGNSHVGIQLGHAGRKASASVPWEGGKPLAPGKGPWQTVSASNVSFAPDWPAPIAADLAELERLRRAFIEAAERTLRAGFDLIELHGAHGYLLHQFLSPLSNQRTDSYGGTLENRMRFPLEIIREVRRVWPKEKPLGIRISAVDWYPGGLTIDESVKFVTAAKAEGIDYVCVSSGGSVPHPIGLTNTPGFQVPFAERIRRETGIVTRAVGLIVEPHQAEAIVASGQADLVALARGFLDNPRWVWHAAEILGAEAFYPPPYQRVRAKSWPGAAMRHPARAAE